MQRTIHYFGQGYSFSQPTGRLPGKPACGAKAKTGTTIKKDVTCISCKKLIVP